MHIMLRTTFSDHALVILSISNQCFQDFSILKIPEILLLDNSFSLQVARLWSQKNVLQDSMAMRVANGLQENS